jgi:hypothetical protein
MFIEKQIILNGCIQKYLFNKIILNGMNMNNVVK